MSVRRSPDSANRLIQNAQQSAFNGALKGRLRSARPTDRPRPSRIPSTAGGDVTGSVISFPTPSSAARPGDMYITQSGIPFILRGNGEWTQVFTNESEFTANKNDPDDAGAADYAIGYDVLLAPGGDYNFLAGSFIDFTGVSTLLYGSIVGNQLQANVEDEATLQSLHMLGYGHEFSLLGGAEGVYITLAGSLNFVTSDANVNYLGFFGDGNEFVSSGSPGSSVTWLYMVGGGNSASIGSGLSNTSIFGFQNDITGGNNLTVLGALNIVTAGAYNDTVIGFSNAHANTGGNSTIIGFSNSTSGAAGNNSVLGFYNTIGGSAPVFASIFGSTSQALSQYALIAGHGSQVSGDNSAVFGHDSFVSGVGSYSLGANNDISGDKSYILGTSNEISGDLSWILGPEAYNSSPLATDEYGVLAARVVDIFRSRDAVGTLSPVGDYSTYLVLRESDDTAVTLGVNAGELTVDGSPISGGGGGGATGFDYTNGTASTTWTITHGLGYYPIVQTFDTAGDVIVGAINHTDVNEVVVTFSTAVDGGARLI